MRKHQGNPLRSKWTAILHMKVEEETGKYIVVVEVKNDEAVGSLTIQKTGEVLVGAEKSNRADTDKIKEWSGKGSKPSV